jgi:hypothetical protein
MSIVSVGRIVEWNLIISGNNYRKLPIRYLDDKSDFLMVFLNIFHANAGKEENVMSMLSFQSSLSSTDATLRRSGVRLNKNIKLCK